MGEIQGNPANQFFSGMNNVKYRNSGTYDWQLFNEDNLSKDNPPNPMTWIYYYPYKYSFTQMACSVRLVASKPFVKPGDCYER